jgi:hypothetical protein
MSLLDRISILLRTQWMSGTIRAKENVQTLEHINDDWFAYVTPNSKSEDLNISFQKGPSPFRWWWMHFCGTVSTWRNFGSYNSAGAVPCYVSPTCDIQIFSEFVYSSLTVNESEGITSTFQCWKNLQISIQCKARQRDCIPFRQSYVVLRCITWNYLSL